MDPVGVNSTITWPAGTFLPNFRMVFQLGMAVGHGRIIVTSFPFIRSRRNPPSSSLNIHPEALTVYGEISTNRKWFGRLYRQTTEGRRSAPGSNTDTT
jgi:hypothetical protein